MTIKKIDEFERGYRRGVQFALLQLLHNYGELKVISDKQRISAKVFLNAYLNDLDLFIDYGANAFVVFTEHDKKKVPTKAKIYKDKWHWKRSKKAEKINKLIDVLIDNKNEVNNGNK